MRWPWQRRSTEDNVSSAREKLAEAEEQLRRTVELEPEVRRQAAQLKSLREQNQFAAMIAKALRSSP